jgi:Ca2+-binding EF-hand superfamily protein
MTKTLILSLVFLSSPAFAGAVPSKKQSAKDVVFTKLFNEADADLDGWLNEAEFGRSYGASDTPVVTEFRFKMMTSLIVPSLRVSPPVVLPEPVLPPIGVSLDAFIRQNGGRRLNPNRFERFLYADDDQDGFLDPEEFVATRVAPSAARGKVAQAFNKLDKNDDSLISPSEWGGFNDG